MNKRRLCYAVVFVILLLVEIFIALFVRDKFIRPYFGDVLVTVLLCCLFRVFFPKGVATLPIYVFGFAALVEIAQYFQIVKLLGFENNALICTLVGTSFSFIDLVCYGVGCFAFWVIEKWQIKND